MFLSYQAASVQFQGRWYDTGKSAVTTAPGAYFRCAFKGELIRLYFDITGNINPYPHLYLSIDGGSRFEAPVDRYLVVRTAPGEHTLTVIYKSANEQQARWYAPLEGKIVFCGYEAEAPGTLTQDTRPQMEFVGDSITEGILIDASCHYNDENPCVEDRTLQDDSTAGYAWLTAEAMGYRPILMGYGAVGATHSGSGLVPAAPESYPFCYENAPISHRNPEVIIVNHGANDRRNRDRYAECYTQLLDVIREHNPESKIVSLSPFCGWMDDLLPEIIKNYNETRGTRIPLIMSTGWIPEAPLHPLRDGHRIVAAHLTEELKKLGIR